MSGNPISKRSWGGFDEHPTNEQCYRQERTAMLLSLLLGPLGADQFYAHHWLLAAFKLLTGGGFGIWAFVDCKQVWNLKYSLANICIGILWIIGGVYGTPGCPGGFGTGGEWRYWSKGKGKGLGSAFEPLVTGEPSRLPLRKLLSFLFVIVGILPSEALCSSIKFFFSPDSQSTLVTLCLLREPSLLASHCASAMTFHYFDVYDRLFLNLETTVSPLSLRSRWIYRDVCVVVVICCCDTIYVYVSPISLIQ